MLKIIVVLIVLFELAKVLNLKTHAEAFENLKNFGKLKTDEERLSFIKSIKHPVLTFFIVLSEIMYIFVLVMLLFTPLVWISVTVLLLGIAFGILNVITDKKYDAVVTMMDVIITIGVMVYAFHSILN